MIECLFTIDYEIYGNGEGSLRELVFEPAERLKVLFERWKARFVPFIEAAELEVIEAGGTDPASGIVRRQIREFHREGFELGLHIHPQWYGARYANEKWIMDYGEYNLCLLPPERIAGIIDRSIAYLRSVLDMPDYVPLSFRAGNWLFQPAKTAARLLAERGLKADSSVFKGGLRHEHGLDYRKAAKNGYFWRFENRADVSDPQGVLVEIPIYTQMVPFWKMVTGKRMEMERKGPSARTARQRMNRLRDLLRFRHPRKLDFCRMTFDELVSMLDQVIRDDRRNPSTYKPIVAIGHTKELSDDGTIERLLAYLAENRIEIVTFGDVFRRGLP